MIAEIVGPSGRVHYRRPVDDQMVDEARRTPGYTVRLVERETVEAPWLRDEHENRAQIVASHHYRTKSR